MKHFVRPDPSRYYIPWPPASRSLRSPSGFRTFRGLLFRSLVFLQLSLVYYLIYLLLRSTTIHFTRPAFSRANLNGVLRIRSSLRFRAFVVPSASYVRHVSPPFSPIGSTSSLTRFQGASLLIYLSCVETGFAIPSGRLRCFPRAGNVSV